MISEWALQVHRVWKTLGKQLRPDVFLNPKRHSLIPTKHPFIVPGMYPSL
jgi:alpha,alpha-trehalase